MPEPFVLMIAGPNGSGKTTLIKKLQEMGIDFGVYVNPDDIAAILDGEYGDRVLAAQQKADYLRESCINGRQSFSFETVMSHPSKIDTLVRAKRAGFFVQMFFVGIDDPKTNIDRVALRVTAGGHDVPIGKIVSRWSRTMALLAKAVLATDRSFIFDNSASGPNVTSPRLIAQWDRAMPGERHELTVFPPIPEWVLRWAINPLSLTTI